MKNRTDSRHHNWLLKGRLVLAIVSARANLCPNKRCGRERRCLARFSLRSNYHRKLGDCPIMSEAEWRAVSLGLQANRKFNAPFYRSRPSPPQPFEILPPGAEKLPPEERFRISTEPWREQARKEYWEKQMAAPGSNTGRCSGRTWRASGCCDRPTR
jgi:hypothetical protein